MLTHTEIIVRKAGETLEAAGAGDDVRDVLPLAGLDTLFDMHSNLAGLPGPQQEGSNRVRPATTGTGASTQEEGATRTAPGCIQKTILK